MKLAIITRGDLPVPSISGGAVETLVDLFIMQNEIYKKFDLLIYSISNKNKEVYEIKSDNIEYINIRSNSLKSKLKNKLLKIKSLVLNQYYGNDYINRVINDLKNRDKIDYIIIENNPTFSIIVKKKIPNIKIIQHLHNSYISYNSPFLKKLLIANDYIFGVSNFICKEVETIYKDYGFKYHIQTWYNAVNENLFKKQINTKELKESLGYNVNDFIVLFSGRIVETKGIDKLLESMSFLENYKDIKLLIIGGSSFANSTNTPFYDKINKLCDKYKERIKFSGYINYNKVYQYYQLSDICVFPSMWNEPFALTALEAMICGKPMIVTNSGGLIEVVDNKCAIILEKNKELPFQIANSIINLYNNHTLRQQMGKHAQDRANKFTCKIFYERFCNLIYGL